MFEGNTSNPILLSDALCDRLWILEIKVPNESPLVSKEAAKKMSILDYMKNTFLTRPAQHNKAPTKASQEHCTTEKKMYHCMFQNSEAGKLLKTLPLQDHLHPTPSLQITTLQDCLQSAVLCRVLPLQDHYKT